MKKALIFIGALLAALPAAAQTPLQPPGQAATAPYTDKASGITFPAAIGRLNRYALAPAKEADGITALYADNVPDRALFLAAVFAGRPPALLRGRTELCTWMARGARQTQLQKAPRAILADVTPPPITGYRALGFSSRDPGGADGVTDRYFYCRDAQVVEFEIRHAPDFNAVGLAIVLIQGLKLDAR